MKISTIKTGDWGNIKAFFTLEIDGFYFSGFKVCKSKDSDNLWIAYPSRKNKDGDYENTVVAKTESSMKLTEIALKAYEIASGDKKEYDDEIPF